MEDLYQKFHAPPILDAGTDRGIGARIILRMGWDPRCSANCTTG